jgi:hypothetical protein
MEVQKTVNGRSEYLSNNVPEDHEPIYNFCFEAIRVGFCIPNFIEAMK